MTITLIVVTISSLPAYLSVVINALHGVGIGLIEWFYMTVYLASLVMAILPRLSLPLRAWGLMVLSYCNAAASFMRLGLAGSGRLWLVIMPVIATILLGPRAGYAMGLLSLAVYAAFSILAVKGLLGGFMVLHENPLTPGYWAEGGTALIVFVCTVLVLVERFVALQKQTLDESLSANEKLSEMAATLRASEDRLRAIGDNLPGGMIYQLSLQPDGPRRFTYMSAGVEKLHGYRPVEVMANPALLYSQVHAEDADRISEEEDRSLRELVPFDIEVRMKDLRGGIRWSRIISQPRVVEGGIILTDGIELDITRRKATEEALRESEAKFRTLSGFNEQLNSISILFAEASTVDDLYRIIAESYFQLTGAIATTASRYEPDSGEIRVASIYDVKGLLDKVEEVLGTRLVDINMQVPPEIVLEIVSQVIIITDSLEILSFGRISKPESDAVMAALGCKKMVGLALHYGSELVGTTFAFLSEDHADVPIEALKTFAYMAGLAVTRKKTEEEILRLNKDLERKIAQRTRELTKAYDELMSTNRDLEKALGELNAAQHQLIQAEKLAALGQLTAGIAHELNTPLGAIISSNRSMIEIMQKKLPGAIRIIPTLDDNELSTFVALFDESITNTADMNSPENRKTKYEIAELLERNGIPDSATVAELVMDSGTQGLKEKLIDLVKVDKRVEILTAIETMSSIRRLGEIIAIASDKASHVVRAFQNYLKQDVSEDYTQVSIPEEMETILTLYQNKIKHSITIIKNYRTDAPVMGNRNNLNQLWINLLNNSFHAMEYRGTIEITTERESYWVIVSISDSGHGIPDAIRHRIFEPFFTTKRHGEGMGLGLDISRKIVEQHGGKIEFESKPGRTLFRVWLKTGSE